MPMCCAAGVLLPFPLLLPPSLCLSHTQTYRSQRALQHEIRPAPLVVKPLRHHARRGGLDLAAAAAAAARARRDKGESSAPEGSHQET